MQVIRIYVIVIDNDNELKEEEGGMTMQLHYGMDELKEVDWSMILPIVLPFMAVGLILVLIALIDLYRNRDSRHHVLMWTLVILLFNTIGPILYFTAGRKEGKAS